MILPDQLASLPNKHAEIQRLMVSFVLLCPVLIISFEPPKFDREADCQDGDYRQR
jgi:hypothetical protein